VAIVNLCFQAKEWSLLNEHIFILTNKKSQFQSAFEAMFRKCFTFIDQMPDKETKLKLIKSLSVVTKGKVNNSTFILMKIYLILQIKMLYY